MSLKYLEIEEGQVQNFFKAVDLIISELKRGNYKGKTYQDFVKLGIEGKTLLCLKRCHFLQYHGHKTPVWLSWKNPIYPENTIYNLRWDYINTCGYDIPPDCNELDENMMQAYYNASEIAQAKKEEEELTNALDEIFSE